MNQEERVNLFWNGVAVGAAVVLFAVFLVVALGAVYQYSVSAPQTLTAQPYATEFYRMIEELTRLAPSRTPVPVP